MQAHASKQPRRVKTKVPGIYRSVSGAYEILDRDSDGRLRSEAVQGDLEAAKAARAEKVAKLHRGERVAPTRLTFGEWSKEWLAGLNKRPRTIAAHRYALDKHLARFNRRKLGAITADDVARLVADMQKNGYAGWTITGTLSTLSSCLGRAKRRGLIPANPVAELTRDERPSVNGGAKRVLSGQEIATVLENATDAFRPLVAVMIFGGLRLGEALALKWEAVNYDAGFLHVREQLSPKRELAELKTSSGRRDGRADPAAGEAAQDALHGEPAEAAGRLPVPHPGRPRPRPAVNGPRDRADVQAGEARRAEAVEPQPAAHVRVAADRRLEA